jgi:hypothetical protein
MVDVEDMIGELEDEDASEEDAEAETNDEQPSEEREETFGLDLDSAWSSPDRSED